MESQTPLQHISSAHEPPSRHAQRKKSSIRPKRRDSKVVSTRKSRKRDVLYKSFRKTSRRYCNALLNSALSSAAETHSNNLVRLASPLLSTSTPPVASPTLAASPSSCPVPSLPSSLSVEDYNVENSLHGNSAGAGAGAGAAGAGAIIHAQGQTKSARVMNTGYSNRIHKTRHKNKNRSSDVSLHLPHHKRPSNLTVQESLRTLIQPLRVQIPTEEHSSEPIANQTIDDTLQQSPFHRVNQQMTSFARVLAAKESELRKLWQDWDDNTREIEELVKEVQNCAGGGGGGGGNSSDSSVDVHRDTDNNNDNNTDAPDKQKQKHQSQPQPQPQPSTFETLAARIETISADAIDAMQTEVRDQQARRRAVREKMLAVLKEGMIGSQ